MDQLKVPDISLRSCVRSLLDCFLILKEIIFSLIVTPVFYFVLLLSSFINILHNAKIYHNLAGGVVGSAVASQQEGSWFQFLSVGPVLCGVCMFSPCMRGTLGVRVSMDGCLSHLSLCGPVMDWRPVQGVPCLSPNDSWDPELD